QPRRRRRRGFRTSGFRRRPPLRRRRQHHADSGLGQSGADDHGARSSCREADGRPRGGAVGRMKHWRAIELVRAGWGAALLLAPQHVMERVHHVDVDTKSVVVVRILGARQLTQATLSGFRPSPEVLAMGVWVDAVHALTALGLSAVDRARARGGLTDAAVAGVWAAAGYRDLA